MSGINVTGNGFAVGNGGTNPGYFDSDGIQIADDVDFIKGNHQFAFGANWIHTKIETLNNRPTNGAFTFNGQSTGLSLADFMVGAVSGGFPPGQPGLRLRRPRLRRRLCAGRLARGANLIVNARPAMGAVHAAAQHL